MNGDNKGKPSATIVRMQPLGDNILPEADENFVETPYVQELTDRAMNYLEVDYPVNFSGPTGTGKTTLAFHVAARRGRPVTLIHGDDEFGSSDLIGRTAGYHKKKLIDHFIHSVLKTEEEMKTLWVDNRLTTACENGDTLIYDEFTRSRPEANNVLLSILAEKILNLPSLRTSGEGYLEVHPEFRAIFTSNPLEYAGVHKSQDALMDRLITISLGHFDRETEVRIAMAKSGISRPDAETIVDIVGELRIRCVGLNSNRPTIRACIAIAQITAHLEAHARGNDPVFRKVCRDVLLSTYAKTSEEIEYQRAEAARKAEEAALKAEEESELKTEEEAELKTEEEAEATNVGQSVVPELVDEIIQKVYGRKRA